jgi:AcrR family transcriptional regulator
LFVNSLRKPRRDARRDRQDTRGRLTAAAATLFAERGFHGTKIRDIALRAGANVAAGHYHFGSKEELYLDVLRTQFAAIRDLLAKRGATPAGRDLDACTREELTRLLRARVVTMLDGLLGPPLSLHGTLMQREMCDPSAALPVIVAEFIEPHMQEMAQILSHLAPGLKAKQVERTTFSIVGQAFFYRLTRPAILLMMGWDEYPRRFSRELAEHITEFSLGGMERLVAHGRRGRRQSIDGARRHGR